jgi:hypothetical protein
MTDPQTEEQVAAYRAELRAVGRNQRLAGFGLVVLGAVLVWGGTRAGGLAEIVQMAGYASLAVGWALMLAAIFLRTRYHRRRMAELLLIGEPSHGCRRAGAHWLISRRSGDRRGVVETGLAKIDRPVPGQPHGGERPAAGRRGPAATAHARSGAARLRAGRVLPVAFTWYAECA